MGKKRSRLTDVVLEDIFVVREGSEALGLVILEVPRERLPEEVLHSHQFDGCMQEPGESAWLTRQCR